MLQHEARTLVGLKDDDYRRKTNSNLAGNHRDCKGKVELGFVEKYVQLLTKSVHFGFL